MYILTNSQQQWIETATTNAAQLLVSRLTFNVRLATVLILSREKWDSFHGNFVSAVIGNNLVRASTTWGKA